MDFQPLKLFITGPTYLSERVRDAALLPEFGHRDSEVRLRLEPALKNLRKIMGASRKYQIILIPGTGSCVLEASIRSLVTEKETVLCVSVGAFGDLYEKIARQNTLRVESLRFPDGEAIDPVILEEKLESLKPAAVTLTHNETSTGVLNDVGVLGRLIRKHDALPLVDGVSILGGAPTDIEEGKHAIYVGSTQKCLALPAGFGIAAISKDALEKAESVAQRGYTLDLLAHAKKSEKFQTLTTTSTTLANQLYVQTEYIVNEEGVENRFQRHARLRDIAHEFIESLPEGYHLFPKKKDASPSVTCIQVPVDLDRKALKEKMRAKGYLFDPGYGKLSVPTIRIGHMGDITEEMLRDYLAAVKEAIRRLNTSSG